MLRTGLLLALAAFAVVSAGCGDTSQASTSKPPAASSSPPSPSPSPSGTVRLIAAQKAQVQQILQASIDHYATEFVAGQTALSHRGTNDFYDWRHSTNIETDLSFLDAFKQADAFYNADNEPDAIANWRDDMSNVSSDIDLWIQVAVSWQINEKSDTDLAAAAAKVNGDLSTVRSDLAQVLAAS